MNADPTMIDKKYDPTGLYSFLGLLAEAKRRNYGARSFDIARGVYERKSGEPCPFLPRAPK